MKDLSLYIHIPFCKAKCRYCDFLSMAAADSVKEQYIQCLLKEIGSYCETHKRVCESYRAVSVFFGGGTPSVLPSQYIAQILREIRKHFVLAENAEITIECNPGTLDAYKLNEYRKMGINRLSMGLQSANDEELRLLGRIHTWKEFEENFYEARAAGFQNINIDLMSSLPGQTLETWQNTVSQVIALKPEHISAYSLIIEEGTPFYDLYHDEDEARARGVKTIHLPDEDTEREMYYETKRILEAAGFHRYEISNYAQDGYESVHNSGYWLRREYIGFGLGAASCIEGFRYSKTDDLNEYLRGNDRDHDVVKLSQEDEIEETMFLGLRMMKGIDKEAFRSSFGISVKDLYGPVIAKMKSQGLLAESEKRLFLTDQGIDVSNTVLAEFLLS